MINPLLGRPQVSTETLVTHRVVSSQGFWTFLARGVVVDGALSRDPGNSADSILTLRPGTLMGKVSATGQYAPSAIGLSSAALTSSGTTLASSAAVATELVRRVGATGTFKLTGPPTAAGTVRTLTATYSAVNTTTGDITITALGVNEVQTINFGAAATGGTFKIGFTLASGALVWTDTIAWNGTDATFLASMNTAIDNILGAGLVVATAIAATDTDLGFVLTFSGAGYAALPQSLVAIDAAALTSVSTVTVTRTTTGTNGAFVTASLIQPTDDSETPLTLIPDGHGLLIPSTSADVEWPLVPIGGVIDFAQVLPAVSDASLKTWVKERLSTLSGGKFTFSDAY